MFSEGWAGTRQERTMGLLDILNGMQNGPRGPSQPGAAPPPAPSPANAGQPGGGLGDLLKGGLGGLLAGGAAGSVISGGLGELLKPFQQNGQGAVANSWGGPGPNKQIAPGD